MKSFLASSRILFLAKSGKRYPVHWAYPLTVMLYAGLVPLISSLCLLPYYFVQMFANPGIPAATGGDSSAFLQNPQAIGPSWELFLSFVPIFIFVWLWLRLVERRPLWTTGLEKPAWWWKYLRGLLIGVGLFTAVILLQALTGSSSSAFRIDFGEFALGSLILISAGWIIQGAAEEILTRGFVLPIVGVRWGLIAGTVISAAIFAILHLFNPNLNWIGLMNLLLFGIFTALYSLFEGGIWGVFAIHSAWNWAQGNLYGLPISGLAINNSLIRIRLAGPTWWTGGAFGPEGGIAATIVLLLACAIVMWLAQRKPRSMPDQEKADNNQ